MTLQIMQFEPHNWPAKAAQLIQNKVDEIVRSEGECSVMLTGGRSAEHLYSAWSQVPAFQEMMIAITEWWCEHFFLAIP